MNEDILEGKWKEMCDQIRDWWGKLTHDEVERAGGNADQIVGLIQQKYGYPYHRAKEEYNRCITDLKLEV